MERRPVYERYGAEYLDPEKLGLSSYDIDAIENHHVRNRERLRVAAKCMTEKLRKIRQVYMIKSRIKDPSRLIDKILRCDIPALSAYLLQLNRLLCKADEIGSTIRLFRERGKDAVVQRPIRLENTRERMING
jgi:hypothetical protein